MTVTNTDNLAAEDGDGAEKDFDFAFKIFAQTELLVYEETSAGVYTLRTLTTHYTVVFDTSAETGTVSYVTAPGDGLESVIIRATALTQGVNFPRESPMPETNYRDTVDKLTLMVQDLQEKINRTALQPIVPPTPGTIEIEAPVDGQTLKWQDDGDGTWTIISEAI